MPQPEYPSEVIVGVHPYEETLVLRPGELVLALPPDKLEERDDIVARLQGTFDFALRQDPPHNGQPQDPLLRWVLLPDGAGMDGAALAQVARRMLHLFPDDLASVLPVYVPDGDLSSATSPVSDRIVVKLREGEESRGIAALSDGLGLTHDANESRRNGRWHVFWVTPRTGEPSTAFSLLGEVKAQPSVERAHLDWGMLFPTLSASLPPPPLPRTSAAPWHVQRLNVNGVMSMYSGDPDVWVGVVDTGCDLEHPDLQGQLTPPSTHYNGDQEAAGAAPPYDPTPDWSRCAPDPLWCNEPHGTLVAGLIRGTPANAAWGIGGMAQGCLLMPLRALSAVLAPSVAPVRVAHAIRWAIEHRVRVINLSLRLPNEAVVNDAIEAAAANDILVVAAAGNHEPGDGSSLAVRFPASHPLCLAVGAADHHDRRKSLSSPDGQQWSSRHGAELDVVAPGVEIWSTDGTGTHARSASGDMVPDLLGRAYASSGDPDGMYFALFGGTSAACALVSGLAALMFSKSPGATAADVREAIMRTCRKVGGYPYVDDPAHPHGLWHPEVGYGLIDPLAALAAI